MTRVLVGRPECRFGAALREAGIDVWHVELVRTRPCPDLSALERLLPEIKEFDGLIFTSPAAADVFLNAAENSEQFKGNVYALGDRAARLLERGGYQVVNYSRANTAEEMVARFARDELKGKRLLFLRGDKSLRVVPGLLEGLAVVEEVVVYTTEDVSISAEQKDLIRSSIDRAELDWVCFFSPSAVESFVRQFGSGEHNTLQAAAIGRTTGEKAASAGFRVGFVSERANADDFARGLIGHIKKID